MVAVVDARAPGCADDGVAEVIDELLARRAEAISRD